MKHSIIAFSAAVLFISGAALAAGKPQPHKALAQPAPAARAGCLDSARFYAHIAFVPAAPGCGHLLSTDTLLAVRRWNRT